MSVELKIKAKSLDAEAKIIRKEELKLKKQMSWARNNQKAEEEGTFYRKYRSVQSHRTWNVRNEARATHLARAFIAGMPYRYIENKRIDDRLFDTYIVPRIHSMVVKYGHPRYTVEDVKNWVNG
jgi:hypothetical protein